MKCLVHFEFFFFQELQQTVEQLNERNSVNDVQNMSVGEPEAASTIIDLQLLEKREEINRLTKKLSSMEEESKKNVTNSNSLVSRKKKQSFGENFQF